MLGMRNRSKNLNAQPTKGIIRHKAFERPAKKCGMIGVDLWAVVMNLYEKYNTLMLVKKDCWAYFIGVIVV